MVKKTDSRQRILDAAAEATRENGFVTREELAQRSGLLQGIVDDHTKRMCQTGDLIRRTRGVFVHPCGTRDDCHVSVSVLLDGSMKLEVGDNVMDLTPKEARLLKMALG